MNRLFYLFSESKKLEALYLCEYENYIDKPKLKTGVYPMGTLLSRAIGLLTPWYDDGLIVLKKEKAIQTAFENFPKYEASFSSISNNDTVVRIVFETLLKDQRYLVSDKTHSEINNLLKALMSYIDACLKDSSNASIYCLTLEANKIGYILSRYNIYNKVKEDKEISNNQRINKYFFTPDTVRKSKRFFILPEPQPAENLYGELKLPIYVYEIHDIVDFIVSSLQCVFEKNYILGKCRFCDSVFIAKDRRTKYCPNQLKTVKSCQERCKLNAQLVRENSSESERVHKNIRTQLANKLGNEEERYKDFLEKSKKYRNKMVKGKTSEEEYIAWMNQYWTDIKAEEKEKKKAKRK